MKKIFTLFFLLASLTNQAQDIADKEKINDLNTPLHLMKPEYKTPYGVAKSVDVKKQIDKVLEYLEKSTPTRVINIATGKDVTDISTIDGYSKLEQGKFRLASYEWGVTYAAMLLVAETSGDARYSKYVSDRFNFLSGIASGFAKLGKKENVDPQMRQILYPHALDDAGAMCSAMIKAQVSGLSTNSRPLIDNYMDFIMNKEYRLADGIFGRMRPHKNSVWLDDMFMAIPAIVNMGKLTGDSKYYDEAVRQILLFKQRMWVPEKKLFRHGWVEGMVDHPAFYWGRANGWAILTMSEVLDVLPANYPGRDKILELFREHVRGLAALQSGEGLWHQLLDRNDSYLETSATAIYTYCIAHGINKAWLAPLTYGPVAMLGWHAVSSKINEAGEVEGTCVGTGMGFDPAYYYKRPVHKYAAHGYGPVLLAGGEMIRLLKKTYPKMNDSAIQFYTEEQNTDQPIFSVK